MDTDAAKSVSGKWKAIAYCRAAPRNYKLSPSASSIRLGYVGHSSQGILDVRILTGRNRSITIKMDVLDADVPLQVEVRDLKQHWFLDSYLVNKVKDTKRGYFIPITYKNGHTFITLNPYNICFKQQKLRWLHLHFLHCATDKLCSSLRRTYPDSTGETVKIILKQIAMSFEQCRSHSLAPSRFRAVIPPKKWIFNHELAINVMWAQRVTLIHVVDIHRGSQIATDLRGRTPADIWTPFIGCWALAYYGYSTMIRLDQDSSFKARAFRDLATASRVVLQFSGAQSYSFIGSGKTYHEPLWRELWILREWNGGMESEAILRYAV